MEAYQGGLFMMQRIQEARVDHGARMVTFEVRPSATASVSDEYHPIMPGTDGCVAFAMAYVILKEKLYDEAFWKRWVNVDLETVRKHIVDDHAYTPEWAEKLSGIPADTIRRIASEFAAAAPACCTMSNRGSAKHYNGVQADRGIRLLDVLVGNVGRPGGFCLSSLRMWGGGKYGQGGLPSVSEPAPKPPKPAGLAAGHARVRRAPRGRARAGGRLPGEWQKLYMGELEHAERVPARLALVRDAGRSARAALHPRGAREGRRLHELHLRGRLRPSRGEASPARCSSTRS